MSHPHPPRPGDDRAAPAASTFRPWLSLSSSSSFPPSPPRPSDPLLLQQQQLWPLTAPLQPAFSSTEGSTLPLLMPLLGSTQQQPSSQTNNSTPSPTRTTLSRALIECQSSGDILANDAKDHEDDDDDDDLIEGDEVVFAGPTDEISTPAEVSSSRSSEFLTLRIKSTRDVTIRARRGDTVHRIKQLVVAALRNAKKSLQKNQPPLQPDEDEEDEEEDQDPYVRLIASGRLLAPDTALLSDFKTIQEGSVIHAVVAHGKGSRGAQAAAATPLLSRRVLRGTGVDGAGWVVRRDQQEEEEEEEEDDDDDEDEDSGSLDAQAAIMEAGRLRYPSRRGAATGNSSSSPSRQTPRRERLGFDRLRDTMRLRRSEITAIRVYFSRSVDRWIRQHPEDAEAAYGTETDLVRRRLMQEDAWMRAQGPASEFRLNLNAAAALTSNPSWRSANMSTTEMWRAGGMSASMGTDRDFLWGFLLGFFVGFLMLVWVWMPTVPHKQKLGILTGISFKLALAMLGGGPDRNGEDESVDDDPTETIIMGEY